jgi:hypothetical protein
MSHKLSRGRMCARLAAMDAAFVGAATAWSSAG